MAPLINPCHLNGVFAGTVHCHCRLHESALQALQSAIGSKKNPLQSESGAGFVLVRFLSKSAYQSASGRMRVPPSAACIALKNTSVLSITPLNIEEPRP